jgi:predicted nucleic acid-binding protein
MVDVNLLLYPVNRDMPQHEAAHQWLEKVFSGNQPVNPLVPVNQSN